LGSPSNCNVTGGLDHTLHIKRVDVAGEMDVLDHARNAVVAGLHSAHYEEGGQEKRSASNGEDIGHGCLSPAFLPLMLMAMPDVLAAGHVIGACTNT